MKKTLLFAFILSLILSSCGGNKKDTKETSKDTLTLQEETPPLNTVTIDKGKLKMHQNGYSIGKDTELTELQKLLKDDKYDVIQITWVWDCSPKYEDMPMKLIYNKTNNNLKLIYTKNNVIEDYNNVQPTCLSDYLKSGKNTFYALVDYCKADYDFNNREMNNHAVGNKPEQSEVDGSVKIVKEYIKENANDASSIEFLEWSKVTPTGEYWAVRCKYKGKNALGGVVTENGWFYIQNNKVVKTK